MCGLKGLEKDVPDKWLKTPLHYASQRGASICAIYLINRGADPEKKDIYGNTALGVGLLNQHYNYGIILIQNKNSASVLPHVFKEQPEKIQKMWDEEERRKKLGSKFKMGEDVEMEDEQEKKKSKKKHRDLFDQNKNVFYDDYGDEYGEEDDYNEEEDSDD